MLALLGIMRQLGVRRLVVACLNPQCRHEAMIGADDYADEAISPDLRHTCKPF
jgi:hypothetical protein